MRFVGAAQLIICNIHNLTPFWSDIQSVFSLCIRTPDHVEGRQYIVNGRTGDCGYNRRLPIFNSVLTIFIQWHYSQAASHPNCSAS